jgi:uncharacterized protein involved in exopolysaccharide biosynthesis
MRQSTVDQSMPPPASDRGEIDLVALFREVGKRKWRILGLTLLTFALAAVIVNVLKPKYTAETRVFLENRDTEYTRIGREGGRQQDERFDQDAIQSQVLIIQSRDIARQVIKKLDLGTKAEFDQTLAGTDIPTTMGVMLGLLTNPASISPEERVIDSYSDKLKVFAVSKSRVIAIEFQSRDASLASRISNAIAEEYIRHLEQAKKGSAKSAGAWLSATIEPLRQRVAEAEAKVESFRSQNGLFQVGRDSLTTISTQQLSELNTQLATARSQQSDLTSKSRLLVEAIRQGRIFEVSEVVNSEGVRRLLETRANLRAQIAQEEQTLLPQHPRIKELRAQLTGLEEQVRATAERTARTLENDAKAAGARVAAAQAELDVQKRQNGNAGGHEVQLRVLEREAKAEREQLETYLARYRDASTRESDNSVAADARIVSRAIVPTNPSFPKKLPIILIATLSAFALSLFSTLMKALLSDQVYARRAVEAPLYPMLPPHMMQMYPGMVMPNPAYAAPGTAPMTAQQPLVVHAEHGTDSVSAAPPPHTDPAPAQPVVVDAVDARTRMGNSMREAYARMTESLKAETSGAPTPFTSVAAAVTPAVPASPPLPVAVNAVPSMVLPVASAAFAQGQQKPSGLPLLTEIDPYDPLLEIAEAAKAAKVAGRPVSILLLSVESVEHSSGTMRALESVLSRTGPAIATDLQPHLITKAGLGAAANSLAGHMDYVLFNGGKVSAQSRGLYEAVTLVVLVASDDLEDPRVDTAEEFLSGSDYFIVSAEALRSGAPAH